MNDEDETENVPTILQKSGLGFISIEFPWENKHVKFYNGTHWHFM